MPAARIDALLSLWGASLVPFDATPPFRNHKDLYATINATKVGDVPWKSFSLNYTGAHPDGPVPLWMDAKYEVWFRDPKKVVHNSIQNLDFCGEFDYAPYHDYVDDKHIFGDFMSGHWA